MSSVIPSFGQQTKISVGLLGGSFNPAHEGHVYISKVAMKRLGLDQVWWLVSPQNPLKSTKEMAPLAERYRQGRDIVRHPRIKVTCLESRLKTQFTQDSLSALKKRYPNVRFIWLMGADNLETFHQWKGWDKIMKMMPICIMHRPKYRLRGLSGKTACRFASFRLSTGKASVLKYQHAPAWVFLPIKGMNISASEIRQKMKDENHRNAR